MKDMSEISQDAMYSIAAEQQLLGCVLSNNDTFHAVSDLIDAEKFAEPTHSEIWKICAGRIQAGSLASAVTVKTLMASSEGLERLGGAKYLAQLAVSAIHPIMARDMAKLIVETWQRRTVYQALEDARDGLIKGEPVSQAMNVMLAVNDAMSVADGRAASISYKQAVVDAMKEAIRAHQGDEIGITLGLGDLDKLLGPLRGGDFAILGGAPSMGKAQPLDAKVLVPGGFKTMGEISVGDEVVAPDGRPSFVSGVFPQGRVKMMKVTFRDGRSVRCCEDHLWKLTGQYGKGKVVSAKELQRLLSLPSSVGRISVPRISAWKGVEKALPVDPWLLGAYIGNGHFSGCNPMISTADAATLWRAMEAVKPDQVVHSAAYDYRIKGGAGRNCKLSEALRELGLHGVRSENKSIPSEYMTASAEQRLELLRGLLDTDGWVESFGAVRYSTSSETLAGQVQELVWSLGGVCSISTKMPKFTHNGESKVGHLHHVLNIRCDDPASLFHAEQKKRRAAKRVKPVRLGVVSVTPDGEDEAQCIAVTHPDHLYVTDSFVVTHNTSLALSIASRAADAGIGVAICSLEMTGESLAFRAMAERSGVAYADIIRGQVNEEDFRKVTEGAAAIADRSIEIIQPHVKDLHSLNAALARIRRQFESRGKRLGLVLVDYLQLVRAPGKGRYEIVSNVSTGLKSIAMQLDVPLIALSQLSRDVQSREDHRPRLTDLRESGQIEQDADFVLFTHRDYYYLLREGPKKNPAERGTATEQAAAMLADHEAELAASRNKMEVICAKLRMGQIGNVTLGFDEKTNQIWQIGQDPRQEAFF